MKTMQRGGRYSRRMESVKSSCVREIMAGLGAETISFAAGLPDPALFPVDAVAAAAATVLAEDAAAALQYGTTEGYLPLREYVAETILRPRGIDATPDEILIVSGSQQALDLIGKVFLDPGDTVLLERPAYMAAIQAFDMCQARYVGAPMTERGIDVGAVRDCLKRAPVRLLYTVPDFQNPTGHCYDEQTRRELVQVLADLPVVLVEDNPYGNLRYEGMPAPWLASLRRHDTVLLGTFSKTFAPGFRLGWVHADAQTIRAMTVAKQAADLCGNQFVQRVLHRYLTENDAGAHLQRLRDHYRTRRDTMLRLLERHMPAGASWTRPRGGMFIWLTLPPRISARRLLVTTAARGVAFAPGESFFADAPERNTLRLNFTHADAAPMEAGIRILAEAIAAEDMAPSL